jgi:transcriptional regulator with XRE-family HTH domain
MANVDPQDAEREEYASFLKALAARIRAMRKERGWTYRDMVMRHGFHLSAWQSYEAGRVGMSLPSLLRVAKAFSVHPSELLAGIEVHAPAPEPPPTVGASVKMPRKRIGATKRH